MRLHVKILTITGALITAGLGTAVPRRRGSSAQLQRQLDRECR
jgi:hypothetical protein